MGSTFVQNNDIAVALFNLKMFRAESTIKRAAFAYISSQLIAKEERDNLAKIFKRCDKDNDGKLSKRDVALSFV